MADATVAFYAEHPEYFGDERSQLVLNNALNGMKAILAILDKYQITALSQNHIVDGIKEL